MRPALLLLALASACAAPDSPPDDSEAADSDVDTDSDSDSDSDADSDADADGDTVLGPDLLVAGDFERGEGAYSGVGYGWETNDAQQHVEDSLDTARPYAGAASQCIATSGSWDAGAIRQVTAYGSVQAGQTYRLTAMVRTEEVSSPAGWYVLGLWWFASDTWMGEVKMQEPDEVNYGWTEIVIQAEAPPGVDRAAAFLTAHTDGTACYDEVRLQRVEGG